LKELSRKHCRRDSGLRLRFGALVPVVRPPDAPFLNELLQTMHAFKQ